MLTGALTGLGVMMKGGESVETKAVSPEKRRMQYNLDICVLGPVFISFESVVKALILGAISKHNLCSVHPNSNISMALLLNAGVASRDICALFPLQLSSPG